MTSLPDAQAALLDEAGFVVSADPTPPLARAHVALELLMRESLTLDLAGRALGVSTGRLRQRLSADVRTLYGVKMGGRAWRLPRFQFATKRRLVTNIDKVLPHLRPDAHPLAVASWFTTPHQDLVVGASEAPVTPIVWLEAGYAPDVACALVAEV